MLTRVVGRQAVTHRRLTWPLRAALVYAATTIAALVAWWVVGDAWWLQPVNLTTFWWSLPAVPLAVLALVARRPFIVLALAVPAALWLGSYGALFVPSLSDPGPHDLRVATFNTWVRTPGIDHVVALADGTDADVLLLQEIFPSRQDAVVAELSPRYPHHAGHVTRTVGGVLVMSRHPIVDVIPVPEAGTHTRATEVVVLDVGGRRVQVVPVHLLSPCPTCGASLTARLDHEGETRQAEMAAILRALRPGLPTIIGGDFNSNDRSRPYRRLMGAGFDDPHRAVGSGPGFTWPNDGSLGALLRIDWIITRGLVPVDAWVGDGGPSDHRPVVVDLRLPEESA